MSFVYSSSAFFPLTAGVLERGENKSESEREKAKLRLIDCFGLEELWHRFIPYNVSLLCSLLSSKEETWKVVFTDMNDIRYSIL